MRPTRFSVTNVSRFAYRGALLRCPPCQTETLPVPGAHGGDNIAQYRVRRRIAQAARTRRPHGEPVTRHGEQVQGQPPSNERRRGRPHSAAREQVSFELAGGHLKQARERLATNAVRPHRGEVCVEGRRAARSQPLASASQCDLAVTNCLSAGLVHLSAPRAFSLFDIAGCWRIRHPETVNRRLKSPAALPKNRYTSLSTIDRHARSALSQIPRSTGALRSHAGL